MFEPPTSLSENVQQFLELSEAQKIVADLNRILHRTAFNPKLTNPCFLLALLFYFAFLGIALPLLLRFSLDEEEPSSLVCPSSTSKVVVGCARATQRVEVYVWSQVGAP